MTTAGKVFSVLNALLAVLFMLLAAPVAHHRIEMQDKIEKERKKIPGLEEAADALERERVRLLADIERADQSLAAARTRAANVKSDLLATIAIRSDRLNDQKDKVTRWTTSLAELRTEIEAREMETAALDAEIKATNDQVGVVNGEINDLTSRLDKARKDLESTLQGIEREYERLLTLVRQRDREPSGNAAR